MPTLTAKFDYRIYLGGEEIVVTHPTTPPTIASLTKKDDQLFVLAASTADTVLWDGTGPLATFTWGAVIAQDGDATLELFDGTTTFDVALRAGFPFFVEGTALTRLRATNPSLTDAVSVRRLLLA